MKINWVVRFKNKAFWISLIPAVLLLIQQVCRMFGVELALEGLSEQLLAIVESVFVILALFGIVVDHTTKGLSDSAQKLTYKEPK